MSKATLSPKLQAQLQDALALHKQGQLAPAAKIYRAILAMAPQNAEANQYLGMVLVQEGDAAAAVPFLQVATRANPKSAGAHLNLGVALAQAGQFSEAIASFDRVLALNPNSLDALRRKAAVLQLNGEALDALVLFDRLLQHDGKNPGLWNDRGAVLRDLERQAEAVESFDRALALLPDYPAALVNKGHVLRDMGRPQDALSHYDRALALMPGNAECLLSRAKALIDIDRRAEALEQFDSVVARDPQNLSAWLLRGQLLQGLKDFRGALDNYTRAMEHHAQSVSLMIDMAKLLENLKSYEAALDGYNKALELEPDNAVVLYHRGMTLNRMNRPEEAVADLQQVYTIAPNYPMLEGTLHHLRMQVCDWSDYAALPGLFQRLQNGETEVNPFPLVALPASAGDQLLASRAYSAKNFPALAPVWKGERYSHDKIRLGYLSADYHRHATAFLAAGLFEAHDRANFEVIAYSYGGNDNSAMRQRLEAGFDEFHDVSRISDEDVAQMIRAREIDILIDLKGFTQDNRLGITARRPAPLQVTYLGYPGTLALPFIDYAIVDRWVVPEKIQPFFSENLIFMPHSYQVNDDKREIGKAPTRADYGLPPDVFVFCSFNHTYKITPDIFDVWMRILQQVPGSVLWLLEANPSAARNLRAEAQKRGVDPSRLIFAPKVPTEDHLARQALAGLFLDNLPCNAHTTASDALWGGLPVLTCPGHTFAGRVAASLLSAVGLPEMIVPDLKAYEETAVHLATHAADLAALRDKLAANRLQKPLFDTKLWTRHVEEAYRAIHARHLAGLPPAHYDVPA